MRTHYLNCGVKALSDDDIEIIGSNRKSEDHLLTLEALFIRDVKPQLNTKEEFRSKTLVIKI